MIQGYNNINKTRTSATTTTEVRCVWSPNCIFASDCFFPTVVLFFLITFYFIVVCLLFWYICYDYLQKYQKYQKPASETKLESRYNKYIDCVFTYFFFLHTVLPLYLFWPFASLLFISYYYVFVTDRIQKSANNNVFWMNHLYWVEDYNQWVWNVHMNLEW